MVAVPSLDTLIIEVCFEEHPEISRKLPTKRDTDIIMEIVDVTTFFM